MRDNPKQLIYGFDKFYLVGHQPADLDWMVGQANFAHWPSHLWRSGCTRKITLRRLEKNCFSQRAFDSKTVTH